MSIKSSNTLATLTAAALALPAIHVSAETEDGKKYSVAVKHHNYQEDDLPQEQTIGGVERYDIKANQFQLQAKINDSLSATLNYQAETMSGASPWYTIKNGNGDIVQVMSGASIKDERQDISANIELVDGLAAYGITVAQSSEDDYESLSFGASFNKQSDDKLSTWSLAADFSNDDITPVESDVFLTRIEQASKHSSSVLVSFNRILTKSTMVQFSLGAINKSGFLSDPYKVVFVNNQLLADSRPGDRKASTAAAQLRYFSSTLDGALHLDYRFYRDDWKINSHTLDVSWFQNFAYDIQIVPSLRLYNQTDSFFYANYYDVARADGFHSTDYRLSEYGAMTIGVKFEKRFGDWLINVLAEKYQSGGSLGLADADVENPALLDFKLLSVGLRVSF